ncbi:DUF5694 domain-containing protein [Elizabethkingia bruuniana]
MNERSESDANLGFYISFVNKIMINKDYFGSNLLAGWYKRNLIIFKIS